MCFGNLVLPRCFVEQTKDNRNREWDRIELKFGIWSLWRFIALHSNWSVPVQKWMNDDDNSVYIRSFLLLSQCCWDFTYPCPAHNIPKKRTTATSLKSMTWIISFFPVLNILSSGTFCNTLSFWSSYLAAVLLFSLPEEKWVCTGKLSEVKFEKVIM